MNKFPDPIEQPDEPGDGKPPVEDPAHPGGH